MKKVLFLEVIKTSIEFKEHQKGLKVGYRFEKKGQNQCKN